MGAVNNGNDDKNQDANGADVTMVVIVAIVAACGVAVLAHIYELPGLALRERYEILRNVGLLVLGFIGLPLAIWRSVVAARQTTEAIKQGRRVEKQMLFTEQQIAAAEENNLAGILEKAASLVAEKNNARISAGIGLLHYVATANKATFSREATDLLTDFVDGKELIDGEPRVLLRALEYLNEIGRKRPTPVIVSVTVKSGDVPFRHLAGVAYNDCEFDGENLPLDGTNTLKDCRLTDCRIGGWNYMVGDIKIERSAIRTLRIQQLRTTKVVLDYCDFTGCRHITPGASLQFKNCYYDVDHPPVRKILKEFGGQLVARDPSDEFEDIDE
ncbi:hypothetical protein C5748_16190 [Phyllobacterium phragmitis]|uniref:Pentapeptide repeat-containing protein n=1 Tax=Phyllobacterium phragmitis TaxID=2670329 RepID=A0A2S9IP88_9HYPH|nr:hypothetical protein [Phyllobacterium phragmitis]PRD42335.1 hypothetical protein C5748_16190 [Phyllobacterium phragmitis]